MDAAQVSEGHQSGEEGTTASPSLRGGRDRDMSFVDEDSRRVAFFGSSPVMDVEGNHHLLRIPHDFSIPFLASFSGKAEKKKEEEAPLAHTSQSSPSLSLSVAAFQAESNKEETSAT